MAAYQSRGGSVRISGQRDLYALKKQLDKTAKGLSKELKKGIENAGEPLRGKIAREAYWSKRIPGAVKVNTRFTAKTTSVVLTVNAKKAPHARPFENDGKQGTFTHPVPVNARRSRRGRAAQAVRGQRNVKQRARPFFYNTITDDDRRITREAVEKVADRIERLAGFK